jgi:FkbM family methyltransferase
MKGPGVFGTYLEKPYEPMVAQALCRLIQPGWVCADVGAHLGYFTLLLAHLVGEEGHVFAFEARPENCRWLEENIALNRLTARVTVENLAVSDGSQTFVYLNAPAYYTTEWSIVRASPVHRSLEVQAIALDQYFAKGPHVNFIKMDIEGAEYLALQGMRRLLQRDRPISPIELHGEEGQMAAELLNGSEYTLTDLEGQPIAGPVFPSHILARPR